ncbi:MAG: CatA-like O-acetyltransferase [Lutibacter sp.]|uniref:CatA-like O-acetyltransferase n=1 Tax=Lutibacter sp. TaxID=1925666 RepID=UPI00299F1794|nr:CatA-like O-acetyltransferase [Lutibacter sp.]MDX1829878.1 CatA-like O-acetyltransferase [Lutibacter sp.]
MKEFDVANWNRKPQFEFFKSYEDPFFNVTANLEVTNLYNFCKKHNLSFSLACIFVALKSINEIDEFKLRIQNNKVYSFEKVDIGSTILNDDNTFSFCYYNYNPSIFEFDKAGKQVIENHKKGIVFEPKEEMLNLVHCSTLPWISFTGFKHARKGDEAEKGIPKIIFGKLFEENQIKKIPFSVEASHALMDGYHVALLFDKMQQFINELL